MVTHPRASGSFPSTRDAPWRLALHAARSSRDGTPSSSSPNIACETRVPCSPSCCCSRPRHSHPAPNKSCTPTAVTDARQDSSGRWSAVRDGRRIVLTPGIVVVMIDEEGVEHELIPALAERELTVEQVALLEALRDPGNEYWLFEFQPLAESPARATHDSLVELTQHKDKALRLRAVQALCRLATRESVVAATTAILAEKHSKTRTQASSALFSVQEIFVRSPAAIKLAADGLEDSVKLVRVTFALLCAAAEVDGAVAILQKDGVRNSDHHIREAAALTLGRLGDGSGTKTLLSMLSRKAIPGLEGLQESSRREQLSHEKVQVCAALGAIGNPKTLSALKKAASSKLPGVSAAALRAMQLIEAENEE